LVAKVAPTDSPVIITGETGTGKELVGRVIQRLSRRSDRPYVTVNCGAIPAALVESELFGHKRGSFTDAVADKKGLFEIANGGTLLLDEIGELPLAAQVKLLRTLEDMEIRRVGDTSPIRVDVRVLAATNRDLLEEIKKGAFREDLWYRLNVIQIHLPPLRDRREDLAVLLRWFLNEANRKFRKSVIAVAPEALTVLGAYAFPGNVRELRNVVEHAVVMAERDTIRREDLPVHVVASSTRQRLLGSSVAVPPPAGGFRTLADAERDLIRETLARLEGNQTEAAKRLGISRSTLWRKIKEYQISV
ncbi:MAG: sigma-54 dependent transcriptional regulator, partial [bacterium]